MQRETKIAHVADFGSALRQARRRLGLAQKETAEFCGVSGSRCPDIWQLASLVFYNYLIGDCDAHLKNWSVVYSGD